MDRTTYPIHSTNDGFEYLFISEGIRGNILKGISIEYIPDDQPHFLRPIYNLAFGDAKLVGDNWALNDSVRSGNGDMPKVIATVVKVAVEFLTRHKNATLSFQGYLDEKSLAMGKNQRNILYQRAIDSNWDELSVKFCFWGAKTGKFEEYSIGNQHERILVKLK
ncbi:hypothetical protein SAMN04487996_103199 [Dyadobacter soli]|uniref:Uncharacterized protein n=1 Tax=Dyadobacter soli TaxID=659014 RepID=A0A1G6ZRK7_9BACT|nr:hypothetical protein [Dyadobacter soli]SDE04847.1 hypothetical protein SAMN04487996_103199 [Dyadobacter soli]